MPTSIELWKDTEQQTFTSVLSNMFNDHETFALSCENKCEKALRRITRVTIYWDLFHNRVMWCRARYKL